ncbi:uncharacterized protein [Linepithema humile]|uniref:uncharacterized protein n=1 Tax=Linepithema humile TaxID=83485 RepID=UPI00351ED68E
MSALSATEARNKRKTIKAMVTRIRHFIEASDSTQLSSFDLTERSKKLHNLWDQYDEIQTRIETLDLASNGDRDEAALHKHHSDERANFETTYFNLVACLEANIHNLERRENRENAEPQNSVAQLHNNPMSSQLRLPKIELPSFTGNSEDWYTFYDSFEKLINSNPHLSEIQKFHYLRSSLKGEAAEVIKAFEITTENYKEAWELLIERYDNRRRIVQGHIKSLFDLPVMSKENHSQLRVLLDGVCKHLRALRALERLVEKWDDLIIYLVTSKLDAATKKEWEISRSDSSIPTFKQLKDFLLQRCLALEAIVSKSTSTSLTGNNVALPKTKRTVTNAATANLACECCKENHFIYQCDSFKKLPVDKRFKIVKNSRLCINCLKTNKHQAKTCPSSSCRKCQKTHNTLLHFESNTEPEINQNVSSDNKEMSIPVVTQCSLQNPSKILLSTAIIHVEDSRGKAHACRALLDSGSQLNFVTEDFAKRLRLNKQFINMPISGIAQDFIHLSRFKIPPNIQLADPNFNVPNDIDLLIGAEVFWQLLSIGHIKACQDHPTIQKTKLGWILSGHIVDPLVQRKRKAAFCHVSTIDDLNKAISKFWQVEDNYRHNTNVFSPEELACETLFQESTLRNDEGRFIVKLPIRNDIISQVGESREIAERRFFALERRLSKQPDIYEEYRRFMREYQDLNYMNPIEVTAEHDNNIQYYLPHHAVLNNTSTTTKLRVVFDASCKSKSGKSLNDALLVGPTIQQDLFSILSRFRTFRFAMTADIAKMYRQVLVDPSQRCLQRIFWRDTPQHKLKTFELATITYGTASASFLAIHCLQELAQEGSTLFPIGSKIILRDFYVDDMLTGASTLNEALHIKEQTMALLQKGGFKLRKWFSNNSLLQDECLAIDKEIDAGNECDKTRALGVFWNCKRDTFNFVNSNNYQSSIKPTKRNILARIASIFDPLGFLGSVIVVGKLIMQELWLLKIDWDESIPMDLITKWQDYEQQLKCLSNIEIPRKITVDEPKLLEIHGFADASQQAYEACVYLRSLSPNGEIQSLSLIENWRHVSSKENPADLLSRGVMPELLAQSTTWWHGPEWLEGMDSGWPVSVIDAPNDIPEKRGSSKSCSSFIVTLESKFDIFEKYSSYKKLIRIFAFCLRFINAIKHKQNKFNHKCSNDNLIKQVPPCSNEELENAKLALVKIVQRSSFKREIDDISKFGVVNRKSSVLKLNPYLDANGILRVGGRLKHSKLSYDAKHPILIPGRHSFTRLIVIHEHTRLLHAGAQMTLSAIRQNFWPCIGRSVVRNIISKCVICFRNVPKLSNTLMGDLPESRVSVFKRPFEKCGVDYAGPMYYKEGQRKNSRLVKCFISIFVCFATKAVHIELVGDLTTETFLNALKRFISRRGRPSDIYSDNGLNFVGAEHQLSELYDILNDDKSRRKIIENTSGELQIEAILNSRPLTPLSADPNDLSVLTAAHFLIGCPITSYPEASLEGLNENRLTRWQRIEQLRQNFWRRWTKEYLHNCQQRSKWNTVGVPVTVGQLVIVQEDNLPPLVWALGRIEETCPGDDGIVRAALVRTAKGIYKRPITKLCMLSID